jgi:hypothetical protein
MRRHATLIFAALALPMIAAGPQKERTYFTITLDDASGPRQLEVESYSWGIGSRIGGANALTLEDTAGAEPDKSRSGHSMLGASDKVTVGGTRTDNVTAGPRKWPNLVLKQGTTAPPPGPGILMIKGSVPDCAAGKRYAGMQFAASGKRYALDDVVIDACVPGGATFRYGKVKVRGWDPEKKEL